ncbi:hypothetical protein PV325_005601 [Microctonus aethiopoides]|uniref:Cytochrome c oxidase subunit n=1 Tax=Microctonus aethiopoides TaxID=144406 RepID=A0AA39EZH8_9HYME|nr:hypothetical protein PV325_005601 [Microctonus aethiopoides]KAK0092082.1 hypothetical protein PV326_002221 [Microctonus aethiopoides]KAK0160712.1 hypothetical protein PV328_008093 [Microctonus aethiopoides]
MAARFSFGRIFSRQYATDMSFVPGYHNHSSDKSVRLWRNLTLFVALPTVALGMVNAYLLTQEEHKEKRPEYIPFEYMRIRTKPFPWGDGNHTFFHNPARNPIPGVGYEVDEE